MFFYWFGVEKTIDGMKGMILLRYNPAIIAAFASILFGIWNKRNHLEWPVGGSVYLLISEIFYFLVWHIQGITGTLDLEFSLRATFPGFYVGLFFTILLLTLSVLWWVMGSCRKSA